VCDSLQMTKTYRLGRARRLINTLATGLLRVGLVGRHTYLLSVTGRRSGQTRSTPVVLLERNGRWLVSPYGQVNWVLNLRAAGRATLSRGRHHERITVREVGPTESAPVLQEYLARARVCRPFFDASPDSPIDAFVAEAGRHPVFRIEPA
jgi:deazaflavin-dependent oxidoreductase (nitroreductase family)